MPLGGDWQNYSANSANLTIQNWPITVAGTAPNVYSYVPLQAVASPESERDFRALRDLTPVEWLRRQIDDVCLRAAMT